MSPKTGLPPELGDGYELTFARLQRMFRSRGVPPDDAADLAQETAARLIVHLRRRGMDPNPLHEGISALIHRIAMNLLIDRVRAGRERALSLEEAAEIAGADDPSDVVSRRQRVNAVRAAVAGLSNRHRRAIALSLDGLGPAEIAEDFGIERNAADALLYRARRRLAQSIRLDQIGIVVALAYARMRDAFRRSEVSAPLLSAAPGGMHLATGLIGLAMSASFSLPSGTDPVEVASGPAHGAPVVATATANDGDLAAAVSNQVGAAAAQPEQTSQRVSVKTKVPVSGNSSRDQLGVDVWRQSDSNSMSGYLVDGTATLRCPSASCALNQVVR